MTTKTTPRAKKPLSISRTRLERRISAAQAANLSWRKLAKLGEPKEKVKSRIRTALIQALKNGEIVGSRPGHRLIDQTFRVEDLLLLVRKQWPSRPLGIRLNLVDDATASATASNLPDETVLPICPETLRQMVREQEGRRWTVEAENALLRAQNLDYEARETKRREHQERSKRRGKW